MKATKALKRLTHFEELISDVIERYSAAAPDIRAVLQDAKAAVIRTRGRETERPSQAIP